MILFSKLRTLATVLALGQSALAELNVLPIVSLPYVNQQASVYNSTGYYYVFKNIRFAQPPLGDLRFQKTAPPGQQEGTVDGGLIEDTACHQWIAAGGFIPDLPEDGVELGTEDCLFLDVYVPKSVFDNRQTHKVPVLSWTHGGGFVFGSKDFVYYGSNPAGLLETAAAASNPIIYVSANYRLGVFGWVSNGNASEIVPNLGLYNIQAALAWVEQYIGLFGGDSSKFTVMGESAGSAALVQQLTSYGGVKEVPFQQAILQSAAWFHDDNNRTNAKAAYSTFLEKTNCSSFDCILNLDSAAMKGANKCLAGAAIIPPGQGGLQGGLGPAPDGPDGFVPDWPMNMIVDGRISKVKSIIVANTRNEALALGVAASDNTTYQVESHVLASIPSISNATLQKIVDLYPGNGTAESSFEAALEFLSDYTVDCYAKFIATAYASTAPSEKANGSYRYTFNIPENEAPHGADIYYTFGYGTESGNKPADWHLQGIVEYVVNGIPAGGVQLQQWTEFGSSGLSEATWLNTTSIGNAADPWAVGGTSEERCQFFLERRQFE